MLSWRLGHDGFRGRAPGSSGCALDENSVISKVQSTPILTPSATDFRAYQGPASDHNERGCAGVGISSASLMLGSHGEFVACWPDVGGRSYGHPLDSLAIMHIE